MNQGEMDLQLAEALLILHRIEQALEQDGMEVAYLDVAQFTLQRLMDVGGEGAKRLREAGVALRAPGLV